MLPPQLNSSGKRKGMEWCLSGATLTEKQTAIAALLPRGWWRFQCLSALKKQPLHLCVTNFLHICNYTYSCKLENEVKIVPEVICTDHVMEEVDLEGHCEGRKKIHLLWSHYTELWDSKEQDLKRRVSKFQDLKGISCLHLRIATDCHQCHPYWRVHTLLWDTVGSNNPRHRGNALCDSHRSAWPGSYEDQDQKRLLLCVINGFFLVSNVDSPKSPPANRASWRGDELIYCQNQRQPLLWAHFSKALQHALVLSTTEHKTEARASCEA